MPEILPCPLLMNRYSNPAFSEDSEGSSHNGDGEDDNYLDPERDYELINDLRRFIMAKDEEETVLEDAHQKH